MPIQNNWDFGIGPANAMKYTANIQPVVPLSISEDWNLIIRTILPVIYQEATDNNPGAPASVGKSHAGLGDTTQSFFFSPKAPVGGWILGAGPVGYYPTATEEDLGGGKWGAGPTIVALQQTPRLHLRHSGQPDLVVRRPAGSPEINSTFLQPFVSFTTKTYTTFCGEYRDHLRLAGGTGDGADELYGSAIGENRQATHRLPSGLPLLHRETRRRAGLGSALHHHVPVSNKIVRQIELARDCRLHHHLKNGSRMAVKLFWI